MASCGSVPRFTPFAALRYRRSEHRRSHRPAVRRAVRGRPRRARGAESTTTSPTSTFPANPTAPTATTRPPTPCSDWIDAGVLVADDTPTFTIYRMRFTDATGTDRDIVGVLGGLEVVDEGAGGVLPHERVTPKASTDRLDLTRATRRQPLAGLGSVAGVRAHGAARRAGRADRLGHRRRRGARRRTGDRPGADRCDRRADRPPTTS